MPLQLIRLESHPHEFAATKVGSVVPDGAFFLDFSRPLERQRWLGIGPTLGLFVPVVHQGEQTGGYVVSVRRGAAYFADIQKLWRQRHPSARLVPLMSADGLQIIADFAAQFPEDSQ